MACGPPRHIRPHSDKYDMVDTAFGPIYEQMNEINLQGGCVWAPWFQHARQHIILREHDFIPEGMDSSLTSAISAPVACVTEADTQSAVGSGMAVTAAARAGSRAARRQTGAAAQLKLASLHVGPHPLPSPWLTTSKMPSRLLQLMRQPTQPYLLPRPALPAPSSPLHLERL